MYILKNYQEAESPKVIGTFKDFELLKDYLVKHTMHLFGWINDHGEPDHYREYPDFTKCEDETDVEAILHDYDYSWWRIELEKYDNYYVIDKGYVTSDGAHVSYEIEPDQVFKYKFDGLVELNKLHPAKNEYVSLEYYEDDEFKDTIETYYGFEAKKILEKVNNYNPLAMMLREGRARKNFTQKELVDKIEVDIRTIQKWESGERTPDAKNILKLIKILELNQDEVEKALE